MGYRRNIAMTFGVEKVTRRWKKFWRFFLFVSTESTNVTDRRMDRRTPRDGGMGRAYAQHHAAKNKLVLLW